MPPFHHRLFCLVFMNHQSMTFSISKFTRTEVCLCVRSIQESELLHTSQYLCFLQAHPLGSISTLAFTGWSQDTLCNCWSKVGRNRSRLKEKRERIWKIINSIINRAHVRRVQKTINMGRRIYFNRGNGNCKDEEWKLVRGQSYSCYTDPSFILVSSLSQVLIQGCYLGVWTGNGQTADKSLQIKHVL